jgi:tetratricopeptide (TPR) repeat protein
MKASLFLVLIVVGMVMSIVSPAQEEIPEKAKKIYEKAEHFYNHFAYFKAIEKYKEFLAIQKKDHNAMMKIASSYYKIKQYEETLAWYDSAVTNGTLPAEHEYQYADVLMNHGMHDRAKYWLEKYLESQPNDKRAREKLEGLRNMHLFYADSSLYSITNLSLNSKFSDFSPTFYKDGFLFVSAREEAQRKKELDHRSNGAYLDIYYCPLLSDTSFGAPEPLSELINSSFHEGPLCLYDSGRKMIFTRNDYVKKSKSKNENVTIHFQMFYTEMDQNNEWVKPVLLNLHDKQYSMGHPTISKDGKTLYFSSNIPGGFGGSDIYKSTWQNNIWSKPVNLGPEINTEGNEMFPYLYDDTILYFSSDGFRGLGGLDIFKANLKQYPIRVFNIGYPFNSTKDDFGIVFNKNASVGYFSSNREDGVGNDDIYCFVVGGKPTKETPAEQIMPLVEVYYTVQILALQNPRLVRRSFLKELKGVVKHDGKDGLHRYTYGEYKGAEDAFGMLKTIQDMGYLDAFIRRVERYVELSKAPGTNVDMLYNRMGRLE